MRKLVDGSREQTSASASASRLAGQLRAQGHTGVHGYGVTDAASVQNYLTYQCTDRQTRDNARRLPADAVVLFVASTVPLESVSSWEGYPVAVVVRDVLLPS